MSLLPPTSSFAERVEALFAVVRGRGLALGALDRVVLAGWAESGAPLRVVARGMLRAAERVRWMGSGGGVPRTLGACRPEVEEEIAAWRQRHLGTRVEVFDTATAGELAPSLAIGDGRPVRVPHERETSERGSSSAPALHREGEPLKLSDRSAPSDPPSSGSILASSESGDRGV
jgi:hypothetical protein